MHEHNCIRSRVVAAHEQNTLRIDHVEHQVIRSEERQIDAGRSLPEGAIVYVPDRAPADVFAESAPLFDVISVARFGLGTCWNGGEVAPANVPSIEAVLNGLGRKAWAALSRSG